MDTEANEANEANLSSPIPTRLGRLTVALEDAFRARVHVERVAAREPDQR